MAQVMVNFEVKGARKVKSGKVREIFDSDSPGFEDKHVIVTTDRISAFDRIIPDPIPSKGFVLNQMSLLWFNFFDDLIPNAIISGDVNDLPEEFYPYREELEGRVALVKKVKPFAIEIVPRKYLYGTFLKDYLKTGSVCGIKLPTGLKEADRLSETIITPSTKAVTGHDENITHARAIDLVGEYAFNKVKKYSLLIYETACGIAESIGVIIADTKFEFGIDEDGRIVWIDEALTPDSSRFWPLNEYKPGGPQPSFDKQYVRDYLNSLGWNHEPPAPPLPAEVIEKTTQKYLQALEMFRGPLSRFTRTT